MIRRLTALVLACAISLFGYGDVLLWTVDENATVDGVSSIYSFLSPVPDDDLHYPAARVKISGGGLSEPIYLDNYWEEEGADHAELDVGGGYYGVWAGDPGSGYYGVQLQQSYVPSELASEALFSIEVGKMTWDDDTYMSGVFEVLAESDKYTYEQLIANNYIYETFSIAPPGTDWTPMSYHTTPEPSTSIMCIIGLGVLMLKRKTNNV